MGTLMDQLPNDVTHWIDRLRAGDRQALAELVHRFRERLRRMVELRGVGESRRCFSADLPINAFAAETSAEAARSVSTRH
jgi:hypothetical protein